MVQRQVSSSWWREYLSLPSAPPLPDARGAPLFNAEHVAVDAFKLGLSDDPVHRVLFYGREGRCLLYTSPSPRDRTRSRMPSSA